jgi:uncharacterized membrane protein
MGSHWIRKAVTLAAIAYFVMLTNEEASFSPMMGLLLVIILGFVLIEILLGTVTRAEQLMLAGKYKAAGRELKGTLFPPFLLKAYQLKYYSVKTVYLVEAGKVEAAKKTLAQSLELGLAGTSLFFVLGKILKGERDGDKKIAQVIAEIKAIDPAKQDRDTLIQKVNELIFNTISPQ